MKNVYVRGRRVISKECLGTGAPRRAEPRGTGAVPYTDKPALQRYVCHMVAFQSRHPCNHRRGRHQYAPVTTLQRQSSRSTDARRYIAKSSSFAPPRAELSTLNVAVRASCVAASGYGCVLASYWNQFVGIMDAILACRSGKATP